MRSSRSLLAAVQTLLTFTRSSAIRLCDRSSSWLLVCRILHTRRFHTVSKFGCQWTAISCRKFEHRYMPTDCPCFSRFRIGARWPYWNFYKVSTAYNISRSNVVASAACEDQRLDVTQLTGIIKCSMKKSRSLLSTAAQKSGRSGRFGRICAITLSWRYVTAYGNCAPTSAGVFHWPRTGTQRPSAKAAFKSRSLQ